MNRLKTLKDIDSYADSQEIPLDLLQKWGREWKHKAWLADCPGVSWNDPNRALAFNEGIEWFCKHFFNLEDD